MQGNPYHDKEGKFTSSGEQNNSGNGKLREKLNKYGFSSREYEFPTRIRLSNDETGYEEDVQVDKNTVLNLLKEHNLQLDENEMQNFEDNGIIPDSIIKDYFGGENEFEDYLKEYVQNHQDKEEQEDREAMKKFGKYGFYGVGEKDFR